MRAKVKILFVLLMVLITWPFTLFSLIWLKVFSSVGFFDFSAKLLSIIPGLLGQYIRASFYVLTLKKCHFDVSIGFGSFFAQPDVEVGRKVAIGNYSIIGTSTICDNVLISSKVSIISGKYQHSAGSFSAPSDRIETSYQRITIGKRCWLGENSVVMADLGEDCIISAGSIVTKSAPSGITAIGNPARFLRRGNENET